MELCDSAVLRLELHKTLQKTTLLKLYDDDVSELRGKQMALACILKSYVHNMCQPDEHSSVSAVRRFLKNVHDLLGNRSADDLPDVLKTVLESYNQTYCKEAVQILKEALAESIQIDEDHDEDQSEVKYSEDETTFVNNFSGATEQLSFWCVMSSLMVRDITGEEEIQPEELDDIHWFVPILRELLHGHFSDNLEMIMARALDLHAQSKKQSMSAMISQLQRLKESIGNTYKKIDGLVLKNETLLRSNDEHAKCIMRASEDIHILQEKIVELGDTEIEAVPHLRNELLSARYLPPCNFMSGSSSDECTSETPADYLADIDDLSRILRKHDNETLSAGLEIIKDDFNKEYSVATASVEHLQATGNQIRSEEQKLRQIMDIWERQPAQWCLHETLVDGRTLEDWMPLLTTDALDSSTESI